VWELVTGIQTGPELVQQLFVSVTGCNSIVEMLTFTSFKDLLIKDIKKAEGDSITIDFRFYKSHCWN